MKKYNRPTIEALALETIDVIAASGARDAANALAEQLGESVSVEAINQIAQDISKMGNSWSW